MEQKLNHIKIKNPVLAKKIFWFSVISLVLVFSMWGVNLGVLAYNLLVTDMIWPMALTVFGLAWLTIYVLQRTVMAPIGRRLSAAAAKLRS